MAKLDFQTIKNLTDAGRYSDGASLSLLVKATGRKNWVQRLSFDGKRRDLGLGSFPDVGLSTARARASANRALVADWQGSYLRGPRSRLRLRARS